MISRTIILAAALAATVSLTACGDRRPAAPPHTGAAPAPRFLDRHELALQLGNGFRAGLDRLAVMQQPPEGATDLGQPLPAGLVRDVHCRTAAARPSAGRPWPWSCRVRWETVGGRATATRYAVLLQPTGCFSAGARPALPDRRDPTIQTFAENPLNTIVSLRRGC